MQFNYNSFKKTTSKLYLQPQAVLDKVNSMMKKHELPSLHSAVDSLARKQSRTQLSVMSIPLAPSTKTIFGWSPLSYHHLFCQHFPKHQIDVFLFLNMSINSWVDLSLIISLLFDVNPVVPLEVSLWFIIDANPGNLFKNTSTNFLGQFWHDFMRWRPTWPFVSLDP